MSIFEYDAEKHIAMEKEEGRAEGQVEGDAKRQVILIKKNLDKGLSVSQIIDFMDIEVEYIEMVKELLQQYPEESEAVIARKLLAKKL